MYRWVYSYSNRYKTVLGREPPFTSVKPNFRHTIDYVLHSSAEGAAATTGASGVERPLQDYGLEVHGVPTYLQPITTNSVFFLELLK